MRDRIKPMSVKRTTDSFQRKESRNIPPWELNPDPPTVQLDAIAFRPDEIAIGLKIFENHIHQLSDSLPQILLMKSKTLNHLFIICST